MNTKRWGVLCAMSFMAIMCVAKEWRLTVLIDGAGLPKDAYGQIYKAITTEWATQKYPLPVSDISTKETVMLKTVLFGIETYSFGANQIRLMPLSGQGKTVADTQATVKDCAVDSLIDTIIEKHKPLKEQFREQIETDYLALGDGVILISLCPNLENFQNGISLEGKKKLQTIKLARAGDFLLNSEMLSQNIKAARRAYDASVIAAARTPVNPDHILEKLKEVTGKYDKLLESFNGIQNDLASREREHVAVTNNLEKKLVQERAEVARLQKLCIDGNPSAPAEMERLQAALHEAKNKIDQIERQLGEAEQRKRALGVQLESAQKEVIEVKNQLNVATNKLDAANKEIERLKPLIPGTPPPPPPPPPPFPWWVLIMVFVSGGIGWLLWKFWPRKEWAITIEQDERDDVVLVLSGQSPKSFSSVDIIGDAKGLQIRYVPQKDVDSGEKLDVFQVKTAAKDWFLDVGGKQIVLQPDEWSQGLSAGVRYSVYIGKLAAKPAVRFQVAE